MYDPVRSHVEFGLVRVILLQATFLFKEHQNLRLENERHLFEVNPIDHKDDVRPEIRKTGIEPQPPFIANQLSHGINVCGIVCVFKIELLANGVRCMRV